jgi:glycine cleavage system H protein
MSIPNHLLYTREHEWVSIEGDTATVGITEHAASQLGDVVFVDLPSVGASLTSGAVFGTVESVKAVSDLFAPVTGVVVEVNAELSSTPESVNQDAYGKGWMLKVRLANPANKEGLMDAAAYADVVKA